jgi:MraZ protein
MAVFTGTHINRLDKKGRVSVPADFRAQLSADPFQGIVLYPSLKDPALEGMDHKRLDQLADAADELVAFSEEQNQINMIIFGQSRRLPWDAEGRIVLPQDFIDHARVTETVAFVGKGRTFQLWEPVLLQQTVEELRKRAAANPPNLTLRRPAPAGTP